MDVLPLGAQIWPVQPGGKRYSKGRNDFWGAKEQCEEKYCTNFVPPKTKKQLEEEKLKFVEEYDYDYDDEEEESSDQELKA